MQFVDWEDGSVLTAASWRLASELVRRHPKLLSVFQLHPGGGQYDCLSIQASDETLIDLNRNGSIHVLKRLDGRPADCEPASWDDYLQAEPRRFLGALEAAAGLPPPKSVPAATPTTLTLRVLAAIAAVHVKAVHPVDIRSGYFDSSGGSYPEDELFDAFPTLPDDLLRPLPGDSLGVAEYRFWFVTRDGAPILAFETSTGTAWTSHHGEGVDLMATYKAHRRSLNATALDVLVRADIT